MERAPALAECPRCRAAAQAASATAELGEATPEHATPGWLDGSARSLPSRIVLATIPLAWTAIALLYTRRSVLPLVYLTSGATGAAIGTLVGIAGAVALALVLRRVLSRVVIGGEVAAPLAILVASLLGPGVLTGMLVTQQVDRANVAGVEAAPPEWAECSWREARQMRSRETGTVLHVTVTAECAMPDATTMTARFSLDSAWGVDGEHVRLPFWRGRHYGLLIARESASVLGAGGEEAGAGVVHAPVPR